MKRPVVLLSFANDMERHLDSLKKESRLLKKHFRSLDNRNIIRLSREESASTEDIENELTYILDNEKEDLLIFHYSGHANGSHIDLVDGAGNASGLAKLLSNHKESLALVFLNGCSTKAQVDLLLNEGIPAVIATSAPVGDLTAMKFSDVFYNRLCLGANLKQAFEYAVAAIEFNADKRPILEAFESSRGAGRSANNVFPWGMYYLDEKALSFQLPTQAATTTVRPQTDGEVANNEYLLDICYDIANAKKDQELLDNLENGSLTEGEQFEKIIKHFPWPISSQFRVLITNERKQASMERLKKMVDIYIASTQLIYFIVVSNFWDFLIKNKKDQSSELGDNFDLQADNFPQFDYLAQATQLMESIPQDQIKVPELEGFFAELKTLEVTSQDEHASLYEVYNQLEALKGQLILGSIDLDQIDITSRCINAEYALSILLGKMAFLTKYEMITVRDIKTSKDRYDEIATFQHYFGKLSVHNPSSMTISKKPKEYEGKYLYDKAIVLMNDLDQPDHCLVLSPFLIDKNAYTAEEGTSNSTNLFAFAYKAPLKKGAPEEYFYLNCGADWLEWAQLPADQKSKIHTGFKPNTQRRARRHQTPASSPYDKLKEQFQKFEELM
ncbi:MAG: hypothetical protein AAFO07_12620 [Bacteroidota bacterium]